MSHMDQVQGEDLEFQWKANNLQALFEGHTDIQARIDKGHHIMEDHNLNCPKEEQIRFVMTTQQTAMAE
jgi:hypothetical protein